jgi:hypothetical protein
MCGVFTDVSEVYAAPIFEVCPEDRGIMHLLNVAYNFLTHKI